eukprot:scaffold28743_cov45-Attheya_sp.AAC.1
MQFFRRYSYRRSHPHEACHICTHGGRTGRSSSDCTFGGLINNFPKGGRSFGCLYAHREIFYCCRCSNNVLCVVLKPEFPPKCGKTASQDDPRQRHVTSTCSLVISTDCTYTELVGYELIISSRSESSQSSSRKDSVVYSILDSNQH